MADPGGVLRFKNLVFDLDGTLVDSLPGIERSLRAALASRHPDRSLPNGALRPLVGPPLTRIIASLWPDFSSEEVAGMTAAYRTHYLAESCAQTPAFPGVARLLDEFHRAGAKLFVLTNKPLAQTGLILSRQNWTRYFQAVSCPDDERQPFANKATGAVNLRERHALAPAATVLVGDAPDDARAAAAAGFAFIGAGYGYGEIAGHGSSLKENQVLIGCFADLSPLIFSKPALPPIHDYPESLR